MTITPTVAHAWQVDSLSLQRPLHDKNTDIVLDVARSGSVDGTWHTMSVPCDLTWLGRLKEHNVLVSPLLAAKMDACPKENDVQNYMMSNITYLGTYRITRTLYPKSNLLRTSRINGDPRYRKVPDQFDGPSGCQAAPCNREVAPFLP